MNVRRNRMLVRKLKKRRRTRVIGIASTMVLLFSLMTYFGLKMLNQDNQKPESIVASMTDVEETPAVETIIENSGALDEVEKPKPETLEREFVTGVENLSFSLAITAPRKIDFDVLLKGSSYSIRASRYAYDTDEVKGWMKGTTEYHGPKIAFLTFDDGPGKYTPAIPDSSKLPTDTVKMIDRILDQSNSIYKEMPPAIQSTIDDITGMFYQSKYLLSLE